MQEVTKNEIRFYTPSGEYGFLSNFYPSPLELKLFKDSESTIWPTVEHVYQASKFANNSQWRETIRNAGTPSKAKRMGKANSSSIKPSSDWETNKVKVMQYLVYIKFHRHPKLLLKLCETSDAILIENAPNDYFWGCGSDGTGDNMLGKILMEIRSNVPY